MNKSKPTYQELEKRLATAEPIVEALKHHEVDAVVGKEKLAFLLLQEVGEALQESDAGFRAMFELSGVGMFQADTPALRFTRANRSFCEITGYPAEELLKQTWIGLTHPQDRRLAMSRLAKVFRGKANSWSIEKRLVRKDGSVIWVSVSWAALRDDAGRTIKIMGMISDITARKRAEQALSIRSAELRKLAAALTLAQDRERRRIARILHDHIEELLVGVKRRKAPLKTAPQKTVRQALQDVQNFIDQSIAAPPRPDNGKPKRIQKSSAGKGGRR